MSQVSWMYATGAIRLKWIWVWEIASNVAAISACGARRSAVRRGKGRDGERAADGRQEPQGKGRSPEKTEKQVRDLQIEGAEVLPQRKGIVQVTGCR